ncbi:MAG TPA: hypothetical protein VK809_07395 [Bacteroidia bacterium]|jgi:hypothetical protein|nr:hypothetical protein [Bacteroidia bacterium]
MKENQTSEKSSGSSDSNKNQDEQNSQHSSKNGNSTTQKPPATADNKSEKEGKEFIREGHGHDYSTPVAGEDGGTEDQAENKSKKQPTEQGKTPGENSTI